MTVNPQLTLYLLMKNGVFSTIWSKVRVLTSLPLVGMVLGVLANVIAQKKERKEIQVGIEEVKGSCYSYMESERSVCGEGDCGREIVVECVVNGSQAIAFLRIDKPLISSELVNIRR